MVELFGTTVVRMPARRGQSSAAIKRPPGCWPPADHDAVDVALVAVRVLASSGRLRSRLRRTAREAGVPRDMILLLLLFAESNRQLRIADIAEQLGVNSATASRLATRAEAAGLIDKHTSAVDGRVVSCRLAVAGRAAVTRCLDALRPHAAAVLLPRDRAWVETIHEHLAAGAHIDRRTYESGWRAGVRAGMPADA